MFTTAISVSTILRGRWALRALAFAASVATTIGAVAQGQAAQFPRECALKETTAITMIEDHGKRAVVLRCCCAQGLRLLVAR